MVHRVGAAMHGPCGADALSEHHVSVRAHLCLLIAALFDALHIVARRSWILARASAVCRLRRAGVRAAGMWDHGITGRPIECVLAGLSASASARGVCVPGALRSRVDGAKYAVGNVPVGLWVVELGSVPSNLLVVDCRLVICHEEGQGDYQGEGGAADPHLVLFGFFLRFS